MTEPFPFGAVEDEAPVAYDEPAKDKRKTIALCVLTAVVFGGGAYFFLGGGGGETDEAFLVPSRSPRAAAAKAPVTKPVVTLPVASKIQLGRNPFKALYVAPAVASGGSVVVSNGSAVPVTTTPVVAPVSAPAPIVVVSGPAPAPAPVPAGQPTSTSTTPPAPAPAPKPVPAQSTVKLTSVSTKTGKAIATLVMDGKTYSGGDGAVLGGKLLIKQIAQESVEPTKWYVVLQLGDGSPFEVHEHQEVVVQ